MATTFSRSLGGFVALVILASIAIVAIAIAQLPSNIATLPSDFLPILWYILIALIFLATIAWLVYRSARDKRKEGRGSRASGTGSRRGDEEPRIGQTYQLDDEDE